jgi:PleD family two-component response regulator
LTVISIAREGNTRHVKLPPLVRPSALARFWSIHPRTLHTWISQGRLASLRSPGNHVRLRVADIRAFCEREGMPVPPFVTPPPRRAVVAGASETTARAIVRSLKGLAQVETAAGPYEGLVASAATPTDLLVLGASYPRFDAAAAVRAVKRTPAGENLLVIVFGVPTHAAASVLAEAGAARALVRARERELPALARELLTSAVSALAVQAGTE